jgi:hypothetical protein
MRILYNVGVSDVKIHLVNKYNEKILFRPENLLELTKTIYDKIKEKKDLVMFKDNKIDLSRLSLFKEDDLFYELEFQIIDEFLKYLNKSNDLSFILVGTLQREKNNKDTFYLAKIIEIFLENKGIKSEVIKLEEDPTDLKKMLLFYKSLIEKVDKINITTGTPIQSIALTILALKHNKKLFYKKWGKKLEEWDLNEIMKGIK